MCGSFWTEKELKRRQATFLVPARRSRQDSVGARFAPTLDLVFSSSLESRKDHNQLCIQFDQYCFFCSFDTMSALPNLPDSITKDTLVKMMQDAFDAELTRLPDIRYPKERVLSLLAESSVANARTVNELYSLGELYEKVLKARKRVAEQEANLAKTKEEEAQERKIIQAWREIDGQLEAEEASMDEKYEQVEEEDESME